MHISPRQPSPTPSSDAPWPVRPAVLAVLVAVAVSLLRILLTRRLSFCGTPDACYYLGMAQNLASGQGFHARFLYDFQQANPTLPNTGIEYWRPGISLILLLLKPFGAVTLHGSIVLTTLVGVLFSAAAWHIGLRATGDRRIAFGSFALCLLLSPTWIGSASPDSGLFYGAAVAWFLALFTVQRQGAVADAVALVCVCLAYAIRNDAAILVVPLAAVLWSRYRAARFSPQPPAGSSPGYIALMLAGFVLALVPMHLLYRAVLGTAFPSGTAQALFLDNLSDFTRYQEPATLHSLLAHGVKHLVIFRVVTFASILYRVAVLMIGFPALVFLPGLLPREGAARQMDADTGSTRAPELTGPVAFAFTALFVYAIIMPAIGAFSALRSAIALMPFVSVLVMVAIARFARVPRLAIWAATCVLIANAVTGVMEARRDLPVAEMIGAADRDEARHLAELGADPRFAIILTGDPVQFSVTTGYAAVALPSNGLDAIAAAARDFHATHVILDSNSLPASMSVLEARLHPVRTAALEQEHSLILELRGSGTAP